MKPSGWLSFVASLPVLALFGGVGMLAFFIAQSWRPRHNDAAIIALSISCFGVVLVVTAAVVMFLMFAYRQRQMRRFEEQTMAQRYRALPPERPPTWAEGPPMIEDKNVGSWQTTGQGYDLWDAEPNTANKQLQAHE